MAAKRLLIAGVCAPTLAGFTLSAAAPAASASSVQLNITESWSGTLPQRVEPGQTVTLLTSFGQDTYNAPIQISGLGFDLWVGSASIDREVQVQFMNPVTHAWVTIGPNNGQTWTYEFDTFLTEEPGKTYSSGIRFTIGDKAPAGTWTVQYPTVWGVTTQESLPYGAILFPSAPTHTFAFKDSTVGTPTVTHSTAPASVPSTQAAAKPSPHPSPRQTATLVTPTSPAVVQTTASSTVPQPSTSASSTTQIDAAPAADGSRSSTATPVFAFAAAAAVFLSLLGLGLWRRWRRRGI